MLHQRKRVAHFRRPVKTDIVHELAHEKQAQAANGALFKGGFDIRFGNIICVEGLALVTQADGERPRLTVTVMSI